MRLTIDTLPGRAQAVAARLSGLAGFEVNRIEGEGRISARWQTPHGAEAFQALREALRAWDGEIVGVVAAAE